MLPPEAGNSSPVLSFIYALDRGMGRVREGHVLCETVQWGTCNQDSVFPLLASLPLATCQEGSGSVSKLTHYRQEFSLAHGCLPYYSGLLPRLTRLNIIRKGGSHDPL